jgi:hypothetical protein
MLMNFTICIYSIQQLNLSCFSPVGRRFSKNNKNDWLFSENWKCFPCAWKIADDLYLKTAANGTQNHDIVFGILLFTFAYWRAWLKYKKYFDVWRTARHDFLMLTFHISIVTSHRRILYQNSIFSKILGWYDDFTSWMLANQKPWIF